MPLEKDHVVVLHDHVMVVLDNEVGVSVHVKSKRVFCQCFMIMRWLPWKSGRGLFMLTENDFSLSVLSLWCILNENDLVVSV